MIAQNHTNCLLVKGSSKLAKLRMLWPFARIECGGYTVSQNRFLLLLNLTLSNVLHDKSGNDVSGLNFNVGCQTTFTSNEKAGWF